MRQPLGKVLIVRMRGVEVDHGVLQPSLGHVVSTVIRRVFYRLAQLRQNGLIIRANASLHLHPSVKTLVRCATGKRPTDRPPKLSLRATGKFLGT